MKVDKKFFEKFYNVLHKHGFQSLIKDETDSDELLTLPSLPNKRFYNFLSDWKIPFEVETEKGIRKSDQIEPMEDPKLFVLSSERMAPLEKIEIPYSSDGNPDAIEYVLDLDIHSPTGELYLFVKWSQYENDENMWIPLALLNTENDMTMARAFFDLLKHDEVKWHTRFDKEGNIKKPNDSVNDHDSEMDESTFSDESEDSSRIDLGKESDSDRSADSDEYTVITVDDDEEELEKDDIDKLLDSPLSDNIPDANEDEGEEMLDNDVIEYPSKNGEDDSFFG